MTQQVETVEAAGWLVVDESGRFAFFGSSGGTWGFETAEDYRQFLHDVDDPQLTVNARVYELHVTVPRPARVRLSVELTHGEFAAHVAGFASLADPPVQEPAAPAEAAESGSGTRSGDVVDDGQPAATQESAPLQQEKPVPPSAFRPPPSNDEPEPWAETLLAWLWEQQDCSAPASKAAFKLGRDSDWLVKECGSHPWFTTDRLPRGYRLGLSPAGATEMRARD